ncbi:MAG: class I SAM-dependent methyltransferase [Lewinellaceae bacterium]|nr:class I SAM-dependent methyltransferase [Saprospiraceae bacterium]MCB9337169.1 class I SAM-dependent methyltransferase [Lewinellaceae bacterium]
MSYLQKNYPLDDPGTVAACDEISIWSSHFGKLLLEHVPMRKGMRVLDVGTGPGFPLIELAMRFGPASRVSGIDPWQAAVEKAQWKIDFLGLANADITCADAAQLPYPDKTFDLVTSNLGINNFDNPQQVVQECYRVMKPSGRLCLTTNVDGHFREFYAVYETVLKDVGLEEILPKLKAQELHRGTDETIRELLEDARFSVVKIVRDRFAWRFADGTALLNHFLIGIGFLEGWRSILPKEKEEEVFKLIEKKLNEQAEWDGELKLTVPALYVEAVK